MTTDTEWEKWGAQDPYFGVITLPKFRSTQITPEAKEEFFFSGRAHVDHVLHMCRAHLDPNFTPQRVLDFGCGVGRLVIPFAAVAHEVVGMDISPSMLSEARRNCDERGAQQVLLVSSDDFLSAVDGDFDLVHSCIVLQHIEVPRGRELFRRLVERVRPGGVGALHVTFGWDVHAATYGQPPSAALVPAPAPSPFAQIKAVIKERVGMSISASAALLSSPSQDPEMQMNFYNLSELMFILQRGGGHRLYTEITDHGGALGAFMFFKKTPC